MARFVLNSELCLAGGSLRSEIDRYNAMDFQVIAESVVHRERRLLVGREGGGYIQLDSASLPIPVPDDVFARLRSMTHYRPVPTFVNSMLEDGLLHQVAD